MSEALAIETVDLRKTLRLDGGAARTEPARPDWIDLRVPRQERRRQDHHDQAAARHGPPDAAVRRACSVWPRTIRSASVDIRRRTGFVDENKALYDYMTVDEIIRFTAAFYPGWRPDLEKRYLKSFALAAASEDQGVVARHAHQAVAPPRPLSRRRAARARRADVGAGSGRHRRSAAGHRRPRGRREHDGVLLLASARRRRSDRRSHRDHRPGPDGGCRRARGPARRSTGACSSCSMAKRPRSRFARRASCARTDRVA